MGLSLEQQVGQKLLLSFEGKQAPSADILQAIQEQRLAGVTLFRPFNVEDAQQLRSLNDQLQQAAQRANLPPLLIGVDQEGGQLMAVGFGTPLPGNMALGATDSPELARQAGEVLGCELAALGINLEYAPVCDININPSNPVVGVRSFGEVPEQVAKLASALLQGVQSQGVAATVKHFPGHGDTASDSHHGTPVVPHSLERLHQVEFIPFKAAIQAGVRAVMTAHLAVPAVDSITDLPATLSSAILSGILRQELGFEGVIITDAMDMHAIRQGSAAYLDAVCAVQAGADLALLTQFTDQAGIYHSLVQAVQRGLISQERLESSTRRVLSLKNWLAGQKQPDLSMIQCAKHRQIAKDIAERSVTLVRDEHGVLPWRPVPGQKISVVVPKPSDLTPADTSSYIHPDLAGALRRRGVEVEEVILSINPDAQEISQVLQAVEESALVIIGTINACAHAGQASLVQAVLERGQTCVAAALRLPYDLAYFPQAPVFLCTYSILEPAMEALADALLGEIPCTGSLPVRIPGLYECGARKV